MERHNHRKLKEDRPVLALCYDFDRTLTPVDMQAQGFIQDAGFGVEEFWQRCDEEIARHSMDGISAYMKFMKETAEGKIHMTREGLKAYGKKIQLDPGVQDWFSRIRAYGEAQGVIVEHYIISSGLREMIEGTAIAGEFEEIYASYYAYNSQGLAVWPAQIVNYTNKTQYLFRIEKGVLDMTDPGVNDYIPQEDMRVPFSHMVYLGDSDTDIPSMKLVQSNGGHAIGVYDPDTGDKSKVQRMLRDGRIGCYAPADYREGSELDRLLKLIIDTTAHSAKTEALCRKCREESLEA